MEPYLVGKSTGEHDCTRSGYWLGQCLLLVEIQTEPQTGGLSVQANCGSEMMLQLVDRHSEQQHARVYSVVS
jgi:hypothetical protein